MTLRNDDYESRVIAMLNTRLSNGVKDYGLIVEYIKITENMGCRYVFVTDSGRRIDAGSAMRFMNAHNRKLSNAPTKVYPTGADTVFRRRVMKVRRSGSTSLGGSVPNVANVDGESINISSTMTSAGAFPEEYRDNYPNNGDKK